VAFADRTSYVRRMRVHTYGTKRCILRNERAGHKPQNVGR